MNIVIVGGGPAGLYFAILMKRAFPGHAITVYERNRPDDTFGFGVVFSDQTLDNFERYDRDSYTAITDHFAYWDDIEIHFKGTVHRVSGNGFCGCSRTTLLQLLHERARSLGVELVFGREIVDVAALGGADLIVAADGINSRIRDTFADHFRPQVDLRPNKFSWMGSTRPLDAFNFFFRETEAGIFIAHCYQYEPGRSTWVLETDPGTFDRAGLGTMGEEESARFLEGVFAEELQGHRLVTNRSIWRNFPMIRCERWVKGNIVLLGDAKATAHFSIGSGTKLAMEDAIALFEAFRAHPTSVAQALAAFETGRREEVEKTQHAADVSLVWFEHLDRFWHMEPTQFAFGLMTRSKAITYDNLALRAPQFVGKVDRMVAGQARCLGLPVDIARPRPPMFQPFKLRDMVMDNRVVVSPMCQYSAEDGVPNDWHLVHLGSRAVGGAGLIFTEMTDVSEEGLITRGCAGLYNDAQEAAWRRIVDYVHAHSRAKICLQLGHAGRKGGTKLMWEGIDEPLEDGGWPILSASPLPYFPHSRVPRAMTRADMDKVRDDFVAATQRGLRAGFDMVELHCAHGYLLASFISPLTNIRDDAYGGPLANRLRFPLEVFRAMRAAWPDHKPMSVRISATDWKEGGLSGEESVAVARAFAEAGADLIDVSTGQTVHDSAPVYGRMFQTPFSDQIRNEAGLATMCVGNITTADQVNTIIAAGRADLVALARPHLVDPFFTMRAAAWYGVADVHCPPQYLAGKEQIFRNTVRDRQELTELKLKARPKTHQRGPQALLKSAAE
ncbi:bifunctional salicylyl-CoA 5-hydroxylase/oxidoreductase [Chelatococcus sp. SYSU_G07232]|uniref:Bifunctional salicylyl-CoA 5-hydroxylase/oxidoreductase n=1 Tax=Chelatococcus albus TaxID=3047466 RepID=A0ABT7ADP6_9HYPH|nr:bifunctional salicylyl-CoA 5-hydroxylase/oxidoreductase [Chelatococcus sp. SYSU_G07232]MDJ1157506.1 bifunctional salicylyl-CoA 5-hydroxylase/oxidoreductase [Chelatococcus sp. SYSU_G07232]